MKRMQSNQLQKSSSVSPKLQLLPLTSVIAKILLQVLNPAAVFCCCIFCRLSMKLCKYITNTLIIGLFDMLIQ